MKLYNDTSSHSDFSIALNMSDWLFAMSFVYSMSLIFKLRTAYSPPGSKNNNQHLPYFNKLKGGGGQLKIIQKGSLYREAGVCGKLLQTTECFTIRQKQKYIIGPK